MEPICLFVYGTLKRRQKRHGLLAGQELLGEARTQARYRLYDRGSYPCLVEDFERGTAVEGEVWRVSEQVLRKLDEVEGVPELYCRKDIVLVDYPPPVQAYFFKGDVTGLRECGARWPREV